MSSLELLIGPYRSGKTSIAVQEVLSFCRENPLLDSVVITPSARYRALVEDNVRRAAGNTAGIMGLSFETFYYFVKNHSTASGAPDVVLSNRLRNGLLAHVLQTLNRQERLPHLGQIAQLRGTASAVISLIDEFQRAAFSPEEVIAALNNSPSGDGGRHMEFAEIYHRYHQELLQRGCTDQKFQTMQLCRSLAEDVNTGPNYGVIIFDGFDRYSRLHAQLAKGLAARAQKVFVLFDYVPGSDDYRWKKDSYEMLLQELSVTPRSIPARVHKVPSHNCFTALDRFTEMQEIARQIKLLIIKGQATSDDVLVTARHIKTYHTAASSAFEDFGIPYFLDRSYSLASFPVMHFVLALLGLQVNDFKRQDVMAVLTSRYFTADKLGLTKSDIESIDCESLDKFVLSSCRDWSRYLDGSRFKPCLNQLFEQLAPAPEPKTLSEHCRWCEDRLNEFANITKGIEDYNTGSCLLGLRNAFAALIEEERVLGGQPIDYAEFYQRLKELLDTSDFRGKPPGKDYVTICDAELVPNRTYKHVFIAGMLEGEFPAKEGHFNFAGNERLKAWRRRGVLVFNPRTEPGYEDALLKTIIGSASDKVFMSCPRYDTKVKDREELLPSFALRQFLTETDLTYVPAYEEALKTPCSLRDVSSAVLWQASDTNLDNLKSLLPGYSEFFENLQACVAPSRTRLAPVRESCHNGYLVDFVESGAVSIPVKQQLSATSLERYGQCHFQFWGTDILKLSPRKEVDPLNQQRLMGIFYHAVMEQFYEQVREHKVVVKVENRDQLKLLFDAAVNDKFTWLESEPEFHADEFWEFRKKYLRIVLNKFFEHELVLFSSYASDFQPAYCEAAFGEGKKFPALELQAADGRKVSVSGKIDRIDLNKDKTNARVVDYKRSANNRRVGDITSAQSLQLPLYCLAAQEVVVPSCEVSRAEYAIVNTSKSIGVYKPEDVGPSMWAARQCIPEHDTNIRRGNFLVQPAEDFYCKYCTQRKVCRVWELPAAGRHDNNAD